MLLVVVVIIGTVSVFAETKDIVVDVVGEKQSVTAKTSKTVGVVLEENDIALGDDFVINIDEETKIKEVEEVIFVKKKLKGTIIMDGKTIEYKTGATTVRELLLEQEIQVGDLIKLNPTIDTELTEGICIQVIRIRKENQTTEVEDPFLTREISDDSMYVDESVITQEGFNGVISRVEEVVSENDVEVSREIISEEYTTNSIPQIVAYGTKEYPPQASEPQGDSMDGEMMIVNCTAYTSTGNATASGVMPTSNHTVASWGGLPFGTQIYIPAMGCTYTVEDRGGAVGYGIIDIYMDSYNECINFGKQNLEAYITY